MEYHDTFRRCAIAQDAFNRGGCDLAETLRKQSEREIDSWAIRFCYAHYANDMRCIYPIRTLVRNIGLDNSGTHSGENPRYFHRELDETWQPKEFGPATVMDGRITKSFRSVFDPPGEEEEPDTNEEVAQRPPRPSLLKVVRRLFRRPRPDLIPDIVQPSPASAATSEPLRLPETIDVLFVNTFQSMGGAARAADRLFSGVKRAHQSAHFASLIRSPASTDVTGYPDGSVEADQVHELTWLEGRWLKAYPDRNAAFFSPGRSANPLRPSLSGSSIGLAHLHWVALTMLRVEDLAKLDAPVVWTLHDAWAFTGGCHYPGDCEHYRSRCGQCPQLGSRQDDDLSRSLWERKKRVYEALDLTIVTPSAWLASLARQSSLLRGLRVEVIPNGLDTTVFHPLDKSAAKAALGLDVKRPLILFGAQNINDPRKGIDLLLEALRRIDFACTLALFGASTVDLSVARHVTVRLFGEIGDDSALVELYSAADVFVCPSREDNLPNTIAEALACGTPCVAFDSGGAPEMIEHRVSGWLAEAFDPFDLLEGIQWVAQHPQPDALRNAARDKAASDYDLDIVSRRYLDLYESVRRAHKDRRFSDRSAGALPP